MIFARDAALARAAGQHGQQTPGSDMAWEPTELERSMATAGSSGEAVYRVTAGNWEAIVALTSRSSALETRRKMSL